MKTTLRIPRRYRGPSRSGNGGISAGLVATSGAFEDAAAVEVTLRTPPPLDVDLALSRTDAGVALHHGQTLVATARTATLPDDVPDAVDGETARAAMAGYRNRDGHPLPECYVCGTSRGERDSMRLHAGPVAGRDIVATRWTPLAEDGDGTGHVMTPVVWGALDCPSFLGLGAAAPFALLGRLTASVLRRPEIGEPCVVIGWSVRPAEGRKHFGGAAVFGADGARVGWSHATWIQVDPAAFADVRG
ncbi:MAG: hypothetical protein AAF211_00675 [Myxococcota bacterium]